MFRLIIFPVLLIFNTAYASISLFGLDLQLATRDEMRNAVKKSGARLIKEAGSEGFYDEYGSEKLMQGSTNLYLGYVKQDKRLAFVEYQFDGLHHPQLVEKLTKKYGKPQTVRAKFQSDTRYQWSIDGVQILMYQDWPDYKTRLLYFLPQNLQTLRTEYQQFNASRAGAQVIDSELVY